MSAVTKTPNYQSLLRQEQKAATRQRVLDAASGLMEDKGLEELSFAAIYGAGSSWSRHSRYV
jgi:hypothetical protein